MLAASADREPNDTLLRLLDHLLTARSPQAQSTIAARIQDGYSAWVAAVASTSWASASNTVQLLTVSILEALIALGNVSFLSFFKLLCVLDAISTGSASI